MDNWLDSVLRKELGKVEAPRELSGRLSDPQLAKSARTRPLAWAIACVTVVAIGFLGMRARESHAAGPSLGDMTQINAWVKSSTGLELALPSTISPAVRVTEVRVVDPAAPCIELCYQVGGREAKLLVARASGAPGVRHADLKNAINTGQTTWVAHGQTYTLSTAGFEDAHAACLLCHAS